jgi:hypothetical protein
MPTGTLGELVANARGLVGADIVDARVHLEIVGHVRLDVIGTCGILA